MHIRSGPTKPEEDKKALSMEISKDIRMFFMKGGRIKKIKFGVSGEIKKPKKSWSMKQKNYLGKL